MNHFGAWEPRLADRIFNNVKGVKMKKNLIALCALAALGTSAMAQSSVQLVGTADAYFGSMRMAGDNASKSVLNSGGMTTSWFGFKGTEDLGGGLSAFYNLTSFVQFDSGVFGRFTGDTPFARDANLGLSGSFGKFQVGRGLAPNFLPTVIFNPFGDSFTFSPLVLHANVPLFNGTGWGSTTPADTGWSNAMIYSTPNFNGLSANIHYQFGEIANQTGKNNVGANVLYFNGPLALTGFYESDQISNPAVPNPALAETRKDWMLGGSYDFSVVKGFLTYGQVKGSTTNTKATTTSIGVSAPVGPAKILAGYAQTKVDRGNTRSTFTIGYDYYLSKSTDLYAMVMNDRITNFSSGTSIGLGMRKQF